jgi:multicomponent K+:H+ antiporter subunit G
MIIPADFPAWAALLTAVLMLTGAGLTLIGAVGLLRLRNFYARVHAPTLGTTLGVGCVLLASILYFSVLQSRPVVHEVLIAIFVTITTPVSLMLLVSAAMRRDWSEGDPSVPAPREYGGAPPGTGPRPAAGRAAGCGVVFVDTHRLAIGTPWYFRVSGIFRSNLRSATEAKGGA